MMCLQAQPLLQALVLISAHLVLSGLQQLPAVPQLLEALGAQHTRDLGNNGSSSSRGTPRWCVSWEKRALGCTLLSHIRAWCPTYNNHPSLEHPTQLSMPPWAPCIIWHAPFPLSCLPVSRSPPLSITLNPNYWFFGFKFCGS